ncbi:signal transduction histidine kinase/CheY-like chemotaxis protein [Azospirillum lipoferum]|uniref:histidine kinase n=1 Tax=Azospirillum lipoferum TaxID=193 RepID=A0A5A9GH23_AZOLI|nr:MULTISPECIES: hybrid sensor histidine kinase/response regulator [Azospirillum]KAA0593165.1 HAMP domain-containing protein [Azospirillum lipoferum]MCP1613570.1 signal transduction histidine kinase/CheY-like chemotaxis protein [Azospirillum lipoferum]MDW5532333.1 hybrid sensor histidine kinase/response regulator [Azospirillum sp. NL1]
MFLKIFSRSLVARTTASAVVLVSVLVAVPMVVLIQADVRNTRAELAIRAEMATRIVLDDVTSALWDLDPEEALTALGPLRSIDSFAEAVILGTHGERFATFRKPGGTIVGEEAATAATVPLTRQDRSGGARTIGTLLVRLDTGPTDAAIRHHVLVLGGIGAVTLLLVVLGVIWATRGMTLPIAGMTRAMADLAAGDVTVTVPVRHRDDEIGRMAKALDTFRQNAIDLRVAKERAEQAVASKAKFMAAASHDLRQPAQSLLMLTAMLRATAPNPKVAESARKIEQVVMTLKQLLDELLEVSRLDAGGVTANKAVHEVADLFDALDSQYGPVARNKGLAFSVPQYRAPVLTDRVLLLRLLGNLIDNAIRYTQAGQVQVACLESGGSLIVEVRDTGIGIPEDRLDAIWEEFHQIGNPERNRDNGIGLGLSIVRRLAGVLDHPVKVRSTPGKGSVFSVTLPLAPVEQAIDPMGPEMAAVEPVPAPASVPPRPAELPPAPAPVASLATLADAPAKSGEIAILVIDDDQFVLSAISMFLNTAGHRVVGASTVTQGLRAVEGGDIRPDAVIADYHLSATENGLDFIDGVWHRLGLRIPAVLISGRLDSAVTARAAEMGVIVAAKPIMPDRLSALVEEMTAARPAAVALDVAAPHKTQTI